MLTPEQRLAIFQAKLSSVKALLKKINRHVKLAAQNTFPEDAEQQANYIGSCLMNIEKSVQTLSDLVNTAKI